jgi:hypothetical protein
MVTTDFSFQGQYMTEQELQQDKKTEYWRGSFALSQKYKADFEARMATLKLRTLGDLIVLLATADPDILDKLAPHAEKYVANRYKPPAQPPSKVRLVAAKLKNLTPEQLDNLVALAEQAK